jgi:hypothetical protein
MSFNKTSGEVSAICSKKKYIAGPIVIMFGVGFKY